MSANATTAAPKGQTKLAQGKERGDAALGYLDDLDTDEVQKYQLEYGDILFSHINSDLHLGKTAELESVVAANLQHATHLRQSILQKAFTGELSSRDEIVKSSPALTSQRSAALKVTQSSWTSISFPGW